MQYSIIKLSEIKQNSDFRLDAEYYKLEYIKLENEIKKHKYQTLLTKDRKITDGSHEIREYTNSGVIFLRVQDIFDNNIEIKEKIFISEEENAKLLRSQPRKNIDVLITKTGKIGVSTVFNLDSKSNIPADIAILKNNSVLNSYFISTFLNSKFGQFQFIKNQSGLTRPRLVLNSFKELIIPILSNNFQTQIANIVNQSHELRQQANNLYQEAENILLEELNIKNYKPNNKKFFIKKLSETQQVERIDAEYFQPKYDDIINIIKNYSGGYDTIKNLFKIINGSFVSESFYCNDGKISYIRIKDLNYKGQINRNDIISLSESFSLKNETTLNKNDFVFANIGSVGKVNIINNDNLIGAIPSNNTSKMTLKNNKNYYYFLLVLQSFLFQMQIEKEFTQTAQPKISNKQLETLLVPLLSEDKQQQISNKIQESFEKRNYSDKLIDIAKRAVEIAIEEDEDSAIKYIENN